MHKHHSYIYIFTLASLTTTDIFSCQPEQNAAAVHALRSRHDCCCSQGPRGPRGYKGDKGDPGTCSCTPSYGFFYSNSGLPTDGSNIIFQASDTVTSDITLSVDGTTITINNSGVYKFTYIVSGSLQTPIVAANKYFYLFQNSTLKSISAYYASQDSDNICGSGQCLLKIQSGDAINMAINQYTTIASNQWVNASLIIERIDPIA